MSEGSAQFEIVRWSVMLVALIIASYTDVRDRRVPNWLTFPLFITGMLTATLLGGFGEDGFLSSLVGVLVMGGPYVFVYIRGGGGAGDAKLMLGLGAWSGIDIGIFLGIGVMVVGLLWTVIYASFNGGVRPMMYSILVELAAIVRGRSITTETVGPRHGKSGSNSASGDPDDGAAEPVKYDGVAYAPIALAGVLVGGFTWLIYK